MNEGDFGGPEPWTAPNGEAISREKPHGAVAVVFRRAADGIELLMLHRSASGPAFEGDWAWGPPAGLRRPGETVEACAARELLEETGLQTVLRRAVADENGFAVFWGEVPADAAVTLSHEHDRYEWLDVTEARARSHPRMALLELDAGIAAIAAAAHASGS